MASSPDYADHFTDRNIPFGIASSLAHACPQAATRIGNTVLYLHDVAVAGLFCNVPGLPGGLFAEPTLNTFAALPQAVHRAVREAIQSVLRTREGLASAKFPPGSLEDIADVTMHLPVDIHDFSDFSCSLEHVKNAGRIIMANGDPPPAFFNLPIAYQGRASSVVVSGTPIERPMGQFRDRKIRHAPVVYGPSRQMDYELEFAAIVGKPLPMRQRLRATDADEHIFGFVVLNDWSARDIQAFEMTPLGPCNGKNMGTTISPWIVTVDALVPYTVSSIVPRVKGAVPGFLVDLNNTTYDVQMKVEIVTGKGTTAATGTSTTVVGTSQVSSMYWSVRQMMAHIVSAGAALRTGDILATGTVSGAGKGHHGCLLEASEGGQEPILLQDGSTRSFLHDGDIVRMTAVAGDPSCSGVGWGDCTGELLAARPF